MASGLWTAVSGAAAQAQRVDTTANNLSNTNTDGFKKDTPSFKEYLAAQERINQINDVPLGPIKDRDFYPLDGKDQSFVVVDGTYTDFRPGALKVTQSSLDVALDGPGFFEISTPGGIRYTKHGSFKLATDGTLVTNGGYPVLGSQPEGLANAQPGTVVQPNQGGLETQGRVTAVPGETVARLINLQEAQGVGGRGSNLAITEKGEIYIGDRRIGSLSIVEFTNPQLLQKSGTQMWRNDEATNVVSLSTKTQVRQGMIETSNVNPIVEMTELIKAQRQFEQGLKAIKTYDQLMEKESNEIGKM